MNITRVAVWLLIAAILGGTAWIYRLRYEECRAHGFSVFYCALGR